MPVSDDQLELLESYVDGELPAGEEDQLRRRLESEPALSAALDQLRAERDVRAAVWSSYEPDDASVRRLVARVERTVDNHRAWAYRLSRYRVPAAAAACILIGFFVGWVGRGSGGATPLPNGGGAGGGSTLVNARPNPGVVPGGMVVPGSGLTNVGSPVAGASGAAAGGGAVELPIVDEYGRQVGVQRFSSREEAERFIEDLNRWQRTQEQIRQGNLNLVGSEKF